MTDAAETDFIIGVVGAGAMGAGIAQVLVQNGVSVRLYDVGEGAARNARDSIVKRLKRLVEKEKLTEEEALGAADRLAVADSMKELAPAEIVIEAIVEKLEAKVGVFSELEDIVSEKCILATNTSSIPIGAVAAGLSKKDRVAGMHFFNPVPLMRLVEIIPGPDTRADVIKRLVALAETMGRTPVEVTDTPGFLVNFGGRAYPTEALAILQERVAEPAQIDAIMRDCFGFRMGPFELMDLTGIDVNYPVSAFVHEAMFGDPRLRSTAQHKYMLDTGQLGRKTGRGFYDHSENAERPSPDAKCKAKPSTQIFVPEGHSVARNLISECEVVALDSDNGVSPILVELVGEDCAAFAARTGLDHRRLVAIDPLGDLSKRITVMTGPNVNAEMLHGVVALLSSSRGVTAINDSPGFVGQRIAAMVCNLGCEMAQMSLATPEGIDTAMQLGLNYPSGPLAMTNQIGADRVYTILKELQQLTGDDRYRPSGWLRRRAQLGLSALAA